MQTILWYLDKNTVTNFLLQVSSKVHSTPPNRKSNASNTSELSLALEFFFRQKNIGLKNILFENLLTILNYQQTVICKILVYALKHNY